MLKSSISVIMLIQKTFINIIASVIAWIFWVRRTKRIFYITICSKVILIPFIWHVTRSFIRKSREHATFNNIIAAFWVWRIIIFKVSFKFPFFCVNYNAIFFCNVVCFFYCSSVSLFYGSPVLAKFKKHGRTHWRWHKLVSVSRVVYIITKT